LKNVLSGGKDIFFEKCVWNVFTAASQPLTLIIHPKPPLMPSQHFINRVIVIGFMILVGFCLAKAVYSGSFMGIVLALVSLGAGIYFLYILAKAKEEMEREKVV
jgi:hypothetical protein